MIEFETWADGFVGEVVATYCDENVLSDGEVDLRKVDPYFIRAKDLYYYCLGEKISSDGIGEQPRARVFTIAEFTTKSQSTCTPAIPSRLGV